MATVILDFGSGSTCRNDKNIVKKMYDELKKVDTGKHQVTVKWQLFKEAGENILLDRDVFDFAYKYGNELGYQVTSSVFDKESLDFLLQFDPCFVKIANRRELDWLIGEVPRKIPIYVSYKNSDELCNLVEKIKTSEGEDEFLQCVSKYPATIKDYEQYGEWIGLLYRYKAISDHTINFELWHKHQPQIIEWHYKLEDSTGLDAGPFARTPAMLAEVL